MSPASSSTSVGSTLNFTAQATLENDSIEDLTDSVVWSSEPAAAVTFSTSVAGRATVIGSGSISVFAKKAGVTGEASITSSSTTLTSIFLIESGIPNYVGVVKKYQAIGLYSDGTTQDITESVAWASSNTSKANVDDSASKGLTSLLDAGSTIMSAEYDSISGTRSLNVAAATLSSLSISPSNLPVATGYKSSYKVTGTYSDGVKLDLTSSATWTSSNSAVATVSNADPTKGVVTAIGAGAATITATVLSSSATATVAVTSATLSSIMVSPSTLTKPANTTSQLWSEGRFSDNSVLSFTDASLWSSSAANVTVSSTDPTKGFLRAIQAGSATVTSESGANSGTSTITVSTATLVSIAIVPATQSLEISDQQRFRAIGTYSDASTHDITDQVTWSTSDSTKVFVSNSGDFKGMAPAVALGSANLTASLNGITGSSTITVSSSATATISSLHVTPAAATISGTSTQQYVAIATYSDGTTAVVTGSSAWTSSDTGVATVNAATGLVTGVASGNN